MAQNLKPSSAYNRVFGERTSFHISNVKLVFNGENITNISSVLLMRDTTKPSIPIKCEYIERTPRRFMATEAY